MVCYAYYSASFLLLLTVVLQYFANIDSLKPT